MAWLTPRPDHTGRIRYHLQRRDETGRVRSKSLGLAGRDAAEAALAAVGGCRDGTPLTRARRRASAAERRLPNFAQSLRARNALLIREALGRTVPIRCERCGGPTERRLRDALKSKSYYCTARCAQAARTRQRLDLGTRLELVLARALKRLGVHHQSQYRLGRYVLDEYLPHYQAAIEANGAYWHGRPDVAAKDARRRQALATAGIELLELAEADLRDGPALDALIQGWLEEVAARAKAAFEERHRAGLTGLG